jgi:hypothetical protein
METKKMYCSDCEFSHKCMNWESNGYCEDTNALELFKDDGLDDIREQDAEIDELRKQGSYVQTTIE